MKDKERERKKKKERMKERARVREGRPRYVKMKRREWKKVRPRWREM